MSQQISSTNVLPPHSLEAEQAVIGSCLINPEAFAEVSLSATDFYIVKHKYIWRAFERLRDAAIVIDVLTVQEELESVGKLAEIGGAAAFTELVLSVPTSVHISHYAKIVLKKANRRRAIEVANEIVNNAYDEQTEMNLAQFSARIATASVIQGGARPVREFGEAFMDEVTKAYNDPKSVYGLPTGYKAFDKATDGVHKAQTVLIVAEPGIGKSIFVMQMGEQLSDANVADGAHPGAIFSIEMKGKYFYLRRVSSRTGIDTRRIMRGEINDGEYQQVFEASAYIDALPIYLSDKSIITADELRADLTRLKMQYGIEWVVIDFLDLVRDFGFNREHEEIKRKSREIAQTIKELDLAGVVVHTLTQSGQRQKNPHLTDMQGAGADYAADTVFFLTRDETNPHIIHFQQGKERHQEKTTFMMLKQQGFPVFRDLTRQEEEGHYSAQKTNGHQAELHFEIDESLQPDQEPYWDK